MCMMVHMDEKEVSRYFKGNEAHLLLDEMGLDDEKIESILTDDFLDSLPDEEDAMKKNLEIMLLKGKD